MKSRFYSVIFIFSLLFSFSARAKVTKPVTEAGGAPNFTILPGYVSETPSLPDNVDDLVKDLQCSFDVGSESIIFSFFVDPRSPEGTLILPLDLLAEFEIDLSSFNAGSDQVEFGVLNIERILQACDRFASNPSAAASSDIDLEICRDRDLLELLLILYEANFQAVCEYSGLSTVVGNGNNSESLALNAGAGNSENLGLLPSTNQNFRAEMNSGCSLNLRGEMSGLFWMLFLFAIGGCFALRKRLGSSGRFV